MPTNLDIEQIRKKYPARITRAKAIKLYCKESCCAGDMESWKNCDFYACFLWNFRLGREILAKPKSFRKQRKRRVFSVKNKPSDGKLSQENPDLENYDKMLEEDSVSGINKEEGEEDE